MAVPAPGRRADRNKHQVTLPNGLVITVPEYDPALFQVLAYEVRQSRLIDGHDPITEPADPVAVIVDAGNAGAEFGKAGAGNQPDVAGADHGDIHDLSPVMITASSPGCLPARFPGPAGP